MKPQDYQLPQSKVIPPEAVCIEVYTERNTETEVAFGADSWSPRPLHYEIIAEPEHGVLIDQDGFEITKYPTKAIIKYKKYETGLPSPPTVVNKRSQRIFSIIPFPLPSQLNQINTGLPTT